MDSRGVSPGRGGYERGRGKGQRSFPSVSNDQHPGKDKAAAYGRGAHQLPSSQPGQFSSHPRKKKSAQKTIDVREVRSTNLSQELQPHFIKVQGALSNPAYLNPHTAPGLLDICKTLQESRKLNSLQYVFVNQLHSLCHVMQQPSPPTVSEELHYIQLYLLKLGLRDEAKKRLVSIISGPINSLSNPRPPQITLAMHIYREHQFFNEEGLPLSVKRVWQKINKSGCQTEENLLQFCSVVEDIITTDIAQSQPVATDLVVLLDSLQSPDIIKKRHPGWQNASPMFCSEIHQLCNALQVNLLGINENLKPLHIKHYFQFVSRHPNIISKSLLDEYILKARAICHRPADWKAFSEAQESVDNWLQAQAQAPPCCQPTTPTTSHHIPEPIGFIGPVNPASTQPEIANLPELIIDILKKIRTQPGSDQESMKLSAEYARALPNHPDNIILKAQALIAGNCFHEAMQLLNLSNKPEALPYYAIACLGTGQDELCWQIVYQVIGPQASLFIPYIQQRISSGNPIVATQMPNISKELKSQFLHELIRFYMSTGNKVVATELAKNTKVLYQLESFALQLITAETINPGSLPAELQHLSLQPGFTPFQRYLETIRPSESAVTKSKYSIRGGHGRGSIHPKDL